MCIPHHKSIFITVIRNDSEQTKKWLNYFILLITELTVINSWRLILRN